MCGCFSVPLSGLRGMGAARNQQDEANARGKQWTHLAGDLESLDSKTSEFRCSLTAGEFNPGWCPAETHVESLCFAPKGCSGISKRLPASALGRSDGGVTAKENLPQQPHCRAPLRRENVIFRREKSVPKKGREWQR